MNIKIWSGSTPQNQRDIKFFHSCSNSLTFGKQGGLDAAPLRLAGGCDAMLYGDQGWRFFQFLPIGKPDGPVHNTA